MTGDRPQDAVGDVDPVMAALRDLVRQIELADFRDARGHPLVTNEAFLEARDLVRGYDASTPGR